MFFFPLENEICIGTSQSFAISWKRLWNDLGSTSKGCIWGKWNWDWKKNWVGWIPGKMMSPIKLCVFLSIGRGCPSVYMGQAIPGESPGLIFLCKRASCSLACYKQTEESTEFLVIVGLATKSFRAKWRWRKTSMGILRHVDRCGDWQEKYWKWNILLKWSSINFTHREKPCGVTYRERD